MKRTIRIEEYNPLWQGQFEELKAIYSKYLGDAIKRVEHVGSTAVPGLAAKPVLDIDLVITDEKKLTAIIPVLEKIGYQFMGEMGIKDRYSFKACSESTPVTGMQKKWPAHHLYCCLENSSSLNNHLLLRNALRADPVLAKEYGRLKKMLAETKEDMDDYVEGKSDFIAKILLMEGVLKSDVDEISRQNRTK